MNNQVQKFAGFCIKDVLNFVGIGYMVCAVLGSLLYIFVTPVVAYKENWGFGYTMMVLLGCLAMYALPVPIAWKLMKIKEEDVPRKGEWTRTILGIMGVAFGWYLYYFGCLLIVGGFLSLFFGKSFVASLTSCLMFSAMGYGLFRAGRFCIQWRAMKISTEQLRPMQAPAPPIR